MIVGWMQGVMMWEEDDVDGSVGGSFDPTHIKQEVERGVVGNE